MQKMKLEIAGMFQHSQVPTFQVIIKSTSMGYSED